MTLCDPRTIGESVKYRKHRDGGHFPHKLAHMWSARCYAQASLSEAKALVNVLHILQDNRMKEVSEAYIGGAESNALANWEENSRRALALKFTHHSGEKYGHNNMSWMVRRVATRYDGMTVKEALVNAKQKLQHTKDTYLKFSGEYTKALKEAGVDSYSYDEYFKDYYAV